MDTTPDHTERRRARRLLGICCTTHGAHDGLSDMLYVLLPVLAEQFGLSLMQVGLVRGAHRAAMSLCQIPAGLFSERLGERVLLVGGTALAGTAFILAALSSGFPTLLLMLFLAGLGQSVQHPLCSSILSTAYRDGGRRGALGTYNFAGDLGKFTIAGSSSLLLAAGVAWQAPTIWFGMMLVLGAVLLMFALIRVKAGGLPAVSAEIQKAKGWGITNRGGFAALCAIAAIDSSTRTGFLTFVAFLMLAKGVPEGWALQAIPVLLIGGMAGKLACGYLAERIGVIRTVVITEVATALGIILVVVLPNIAAFALLPLLGIALNGTSSVLYGTLGDLVDSDRLSRTFGLFFTLGSVCGIAAPLAYGMLGEWIGIETTLVFVACLVLLTLPLTLALRSAVGYRATAA
jgi:FSR family fosmidomycin resistance protein-like MFS transporter